MHVHRRRPVALSNSDVPGGHDLLVHSCEDCACPVSRQEADQTLPAMVPPGPLIRAENVVEVRIDHEKHALFGPDGGGGVVVLDGAARQLLGLLDRPQSAADLVALGYRESDVIAVLRRMLQGGVVHDADAPPTVQFQESTQLTAWLRTHQCVQPPLPLLLYRQDSRPDGSGHRRKSSKRSCSRPYRMTSGLYG